jgi:hypothetical protein
MPHEKEILDEDIFVKELDKRRQAKIEETVLNFLRKRRSVDGNGYKIGKISKETGLSVHSVSLVLKMSLLYKNGLNGSNTTALIISGRRLKPLEADNQLHKRRTHFVFR